MQQGYGDGPVVQVGVPPGQGLNINYFFTGNDPNKQGNPMGHMQMQNQGGNQEVRGPPCAPSFIVMIYSTVLCR